MKYLLFLVVAFLLGVFLLGVSVNSYLKGSASTYQQYDYCPELVHKK